MDEKLDFSLPDKKRKGLFASSIIIILLLILIILALADLVIKPSNGRSYSANTFSPAARQQESEIAAKLAQRNLYERAARVWIKYLGANKLSAEQRAKTLFQIATLLEKAGIYDEAIEYYYRSEQAAKIDQVSSQINVNIKNCFEKLGKFSALRYELMGRTSLADSKDAGGEVVAEIGAEKITQADLDALIETKIDNQLSAVAAFMTAEQLNEQKKSMLQQYKEPAARKQFLTAWVTQEVLYRQALEEDLTKDAATARLIEELTRSVLGQRLMNAELAGKVNITATDLETYYEANKEKYVEPENPQDPNSPMRQKDFERARDEVTSELLSLKSKDVQQNLIKHLMEKYNVIIHSSVFTPAGESEDGK